MLRSQPTGEDGTDGARAAPVTISSPGTPPGEDGMLRGIGLENEAERQASMALDHYDAPEPEPIDFLGLVSEAEQQAQLYSAQNNRRAWAQSLRAYHNEHYVGSKYTKPDWRGRSKLFVPKTRAAVHKDNAAVAASLFNNIDAINCIPGNESDPQQRASAALMEELVNYRTSRSSGKAALPWFMVAMGARQDAVLTGVCVSKQCWKTSYRKTGEETIWEYDQATGEHVPKTRETYKLEIDRPDVLLIPPENYIIDPSADWTNPVQTSSFFIIHWPMQIDEIRAMQDAPVNPWKDIPEEVIKSCSQIMQGDMEAIRRAREMGLDRMNETQTGNTFKIVWVSESFMRVDGEDYTFYSVGDQHYLTDPRPVREVYPAHFGERPLALGYGALESHRIYPMAPAESWQPLQAEVNDLRNLRLDATKQNVMPISKVRRGRQIDLDQVRRRSSGSAIIVSDKDDVTWEKPPDISNLGVEMSRELDLEFDDLSGQQNFGSVQTNNALGKTLGGLKLAAGAANSVQEFDIRLWIETWTAPVLAQIVQLEQYYESDVIILGICGQKAQLLQKYGVDQITDQLMENQITVRVSVGLGAGDPQARLQKFQAAASIAAPLLAQTPAFQSGEVELDWEALSEEIFGAAGYHDGGKRFFKVNQGPRANPKQDLETEKLKSEIAKNDRTGKAAMFTGISQLAKVALGKRELEANVVDTLLGHQHQARQLGFDHGHRQNEQHLNATDHGHRHGLALAQHKHQTAQDKREAAMSEAEQQAGGDAEMEGAGGSSAAAPSGAGAAAPPSASPPTQPQGAQPPSEIKFVHDPKTGRIVGAKIVPQQRQLPPPRSEPAAAPAPEPAASAEPTPFEQKLLARIEELEKKKKEPRRVVRDANKQIVGVE